MMWVMAVRTTQAVVSEPEILEVAVSGWGNDKGVRGAYTWRTDSDSAVRWSTPCLMKEPSMSEASILSGPKRLATKDLAILSRESVAR
jgi:hypothetical protein